MTDRLARARGDPSPLSSSDPFDAGPFTRLQSSLHLPAPSDPAIATRRALGVAFVGWVPLALLATFADRALPPDAHATFWLDASAHIAYLVTTPLLVLAEGWCLPRLAGLRRRLVTSGVVEGDDVTVLGELAAQARRALDHRGMEILLGALAYLGAIFLSERAYRSHAPTWVAPTATSLSPAGWWRTLVSHPLLLVLLSAWIWRLAVWTRFLYGVARLRLRLVAAHPDRAGGIGFMGHSLRAFAPLALALGTTAAGAAVRSILFEKRFPPPVDLAVVAGVIVLLLAAPVAVFIPPLHRTRARGIREYGELATSVGRKFERRWLGHEAASDALDANDFSATTDLYAITAQVWRMKVLPIGPLDIGILTGAIVLPLLPLISFFVPLRDIAGFLKALVL